MSLRDDLEAVLSRLAPLGWKQWFATQGLDIEATELEAELSRPLPTIVRGQAGMTDFSSEGKRGVEPGQPGLSLLYHALACPSVHPTTNGAPHADASAYPTLAELDVVENFIYSRARRSLDSFEDPVLAVFAYQYRTAENSPHQKHADLGFSRCGIARIGTQAARYDASSRGFTPDPVGGARGAAVLPARYGVFIAERRSPGSQDAVFRASPTDDAQRFLFPVHKVFSGDECLLDENGQPLTLGNLDYREYHINEKLRRVHTSSTDNPDFLPPLPQFDINAWPFVRDSNNDSELVSLQRVGASVLVHSHPHPQLSRTASVVVNGNAELVRFAVPAQAPPRHGRFFSSLTLRAPSGRAAPEYLNIRHRVVGTAGNQTLEDLNETLNQADFERLVINNGGYEAAHFVDNCADGAINAQVDGLESLQTACAYSLVTAIDFFPLVRQVDIQRWVEELYGAEVGLTLPNGNGQRLHFQQGGPRPLSDGRFSRPYQRAPQTVRRSPNPFLPDPGTTRRAFSLAQRDTFTVTAIVGGSSAGTSFAPVETPARTLSWLPDAAADVFAPGWDISTHTVQGNDTYATYGLGSPFLEDAKLCAALNSYWPAAAPDASRTFNVTWAPTTQPLLDSELGYHPQHPRVVAGEVPTNRGWDGEYGPFFQMQNGTHVVNSAHRNRSDYVANALAGFVGFNGLQDVDAEEIIQRMEVLRNCFDLVRQQSVPQNDLWLVVAEKVANWQSWSSQILPRANSSLQGVGYIFGFAQPETASTSLQQAGGWRSEYQSRIEVEFQISSTEVLARVRGGNLQQFGSSLALT